MIYKEISIRVKDAETEGKLTTYLLSKSKELDRNVHPLILICPGGGYEYTSDREAEAIALQWNSFGYHAAVLRYSVYPALFPTSLLEVATCMKLFRENAKEWGIDENRILVQGFSAGGHLAASFGCFWKEDFVAKALELTDSECIRPNGLILAYPVITAGPFTHQGSIDHLLGDGEVREKYLEKMSLENQVTKDVPPTFLWTTSEDGCVPAENAFFFFQALRKNDVPAEIHCFAKGGHGLSLADERTEDPFHGAKERLCTGWMDLANKWLEEVILK